MDKREPSNAVPKADIVTLGATSEEEAREVAKTVDAFIKKSMDEAGMNDTERSVFTALYSMRRTLGILQDDEILPEPMRETIMGLAVQIARQVPKEICDRDKITKLILKVAPEVEKIIETVHKKHCPKCKEGGEHEREDGNANSEAARRLAEKWN